MSSGRSHTSGAPLLPPSRRARGADKWRHLTPPRAAPQPTRRPNVDPRPLSVRPSAQNDHWYRLLPLKGVSVHRYRHVFSWIERGGTVPPISPLTAGAALESRVLHVRSEAIRPPDCWYSTIGTAENMLSKWYSTRNQPVPPRPTGRPNCRFFVWTDGRTRCRSACRPG